MNATRTTAGITPLSIGIILLALATATIHLWLAFQFPSPDMLFILNAVGYVGLVGLLYLPLPQLEGRRHLVRWALIGYTALTFVLYFVMNGFFFNPIGYLDKAIELALIALLLLEGRRSR